MLRAWVPEGSREPQKDMASKLFTFTFTFARHSVVVGYRSFSHTQCTELWNPHHAPTCAHGTHLRTRYPPAHTVPTCAHGTRLRSMRKLFCNYMRKLRIPVPRHSCLHNDRGTPTLKNDRQKSCRQQRSLIKELSDVGRWKLCRCRLHACIRTLTVVTCKPCAQPFAIGQAQASPQLCRCLCRAPQRAEPVPAALLPCLSDDPQRCNAS